MLSLSKRIYRVEDEGPSAEVGVAQVIDGHLITMNSIHTSAIDFMYAMEAVSCPSNIFLKTRFCTYYKAVMPNGSIYSVKKLDWSDKIFQVGSQEIFGHELEVLGKLSNSNLMVPLAYVLTEDNAYLLYEHVHKGTVFDLLHDGRSDVLNWPSRYSIALGVAQGLTFLHGHTQPVLLLDLSTRTIHLKSMNEPQIGDIELYKIIGHSKSSGSLSTIAGTVGYIPPAWTLGGNPKSIISSSWRPAHPSSVASSSSANPPRLRYSQGGGSNNNSKRGKPNHLNSQSLATLLALSTSEMAGLLHLHSTLLPSASLLRQRGNASAAPRRRRACRVEAKIREIFMPALSSTMTEGKIVAWNAAEGDRLAKGDPVVVVESDKADMDVETFHDGFLAAVLVPAGESAPVGSAIALLAESEEEIPLAQSQAANFSSSSSSSATASPPPPPQETAVQEASPTPPPPPPPAPVAVSAPAPPSPATQGGARVVASPYAKKLAKELSVDLSSVTGSGPGGRVVAKDVEAAAAAPKKAAPVAASRPDVPLGSTVPFTTMQGAVSKNMVESLAVPGFRVGYTITTDALDQLYKKIKAKGVTMTALLAKATAMALVQHPVVNSSCRDGQSFTYNSSINIAVAVAIDDGLITPVLQDADKLDIYSLSRKWKELVDKARAKQLQPQEYNSGTFTLSNLGMFGVDRFDAILPPGTGAIMAVGASQPTVVGTKDGRIGIKNQMQVNVTADHRVIYGSDLAAFLQTLSKIIEDPKDLTF